MLFVYTGCVVYVCTCDQVMITWSDFGGIDNKNIFFVMECKFQWAKNVWDTKAWIEITTI